MLATYRAVGFCGPVLFGIRAVAIRWYWIGPESVDGMSDYVVVKSRRYIARDINKGNP